MRRYRFAAVAAAAVILLLPGTARAQEDTVWCGNVKYDGVRIEKEDYDEIHFTIAGARQILPAEEVTKVIHGDPPPAFLAARQAREEGNWESAVQHYRNCARNDRREWVKIYSLFYLGECFRLWGKTEKGKLKEAVKTCEQFLSQHGRHRFVPHATLGLALAAGKYPQREKEKRAFNKLATGKYGTNWNLRGRLGLAQISFRDGGPASLNPGELRTLAGEARNRRLTGIWAEANLLLSQVLLAVGESKKAAVALKVVLKNSDGIENQILARAHNLLGACCLKSGGADSVKKALFEHLKVLVLYTSEREEYLKALRSAIELLERLGGENDKKRAEDLRREYEKAVKPCGK